MTTGTALNLPDDDREIRIAFVEMLFALAISQVAIHVSDVVSIRESAWTEKWPALFHLLVALFLIAASWFGWRKSPSPGMQRGVKSLFSIGFLAALLDVILVILYFIVASTVEITQDNGRTVLEPPTAQPESLWICVVFAVYAIWDLLTDVFARDSLPPLVGVGLLWKAVRAALVSTAASMLCLGMVYIVFRASEHASRGGEVMLLDIALICVILFFRLAKAAENLLAPLLRVQDCAAFARVREVSWSWSTVLLVLYLACILMPKYVL